MVEVDLRLFVTCRLCLDVQGHFQINPDVQQQIKYCFDIDVEQFDGLPQLICKKCENTLREHYAIKKNFIDKQKELKAKVQDNAKNITKSPSAQEESERNNNMAREKRISSTKQEDPYSSSNKTDDIRENITRKKKKVRKKRIVNRLMSSSGDDSDPNDSSVSQIKINAKIHRPNENSISWNANLFKYFICRICDRGFQDREGITKHIKEHSFIHRKYKDVFKMSCLVVMEKSDNKPNLCNSNNAVVYNSDSIIQNNHNPFYYIMYHPKTASDPPDKSPSYISVSKKIRRTSESTDSETFTRKRRRLLSRSSSETVVINQHSENDVASPVNGGNVKTPTVIDCIDLDDSSDNESYESNRKSTSSMNFKNTGEEILDSKPMNNIIKMCHKRYNKHLDSIQKKKIVQNDRVNEDFLQHKVLSIGRKIINNKGINCTGLLRFLEYKDLSVIWKETNALNANNDGKYVRIATRIRGNESIDTSNVGWKNINSIKFDNVETHKSINILKKLKTFKNFNHQEKLKLFTNEVENSNSVEQLPRISAVFSHTDLETTNTDCDNVFQKLLNKNPVPNPKKLPKKVNSEECSSKILKVFSAPNKFPFNNTPQIDENNEMDNNTMPIVTSTVSLAHWVNDAAASTVDPPNTTNDKKTYPRIKVKPVSELMPEKTPNTNETLNALQHPIVIRPNHDITFNEQQTWARQTNPINNISDDCQLLQSQNATFTEQPVWPNSNTALSNQHNTLSINDFSSRSNSSDSSREYIMLDTLEFPNTKTISPFQYLQNLLLVHNITLLNSEQPLPAGSVCLIKLKLVYQQENCDSITLCLALYCCKSKFSIQVMDPNLKNVNINNLSANWQWQLLKIYNDEVVNKVLQTAAKVSLETYQYTNIFFTLLKSIKVINDVT